MFSKYIMALMQDISATYSGTVKMGRGRRPSPPKFPPPPKKKKKKKFLLFKNLPYYLNLWPYVKLFCPDRGFHAGAI